MDDLTKVDIIFKFNQVLVIKLLVLFGTDSLDLYTLGTKNAIKGLK